MPIIKLRCAILGLAAAMAYGSCKEAHPQFPAANTSSSATSLSNAFKLQFPGASDAVWDSTDNQVFVSFTFNDHACEARYTLDGKLESMKSYLLPEELPRSIEHSVKKKFPDAELAIIQQEIIAKDTTYQLEVHDVDTYNYMTYNSSGELLKFERDTTSEEELNDQLQEATPDTSIRY